MTLLETYIEEMSRDLAVNSYSFDFIKERLTNLCALAKNEGHREQIDRQMQKLDLLGQNVTEPEQIKPSN